MDVVSYPYNRMHVGWVKECDDGPDPDGCSTYNKTKRFLERSFNLILEKEEAGCQCPDTVSVPGFQ
jgi:hypothetical protein